jgi:hypothetical protein
MNIMIPYLSAILRSCDRVYVASEVWQTAMMQSRCEVLETIITMRLKDYHGIIIVLDD